MGWSYATAGFLGTKCHELVGGLEPWNFMTFHILGKYIIFPTDFHSIIFRGRFFPPTSHDFPIQTPFAGHFPIAGGVG